MSGTTKSIQSQITDASKIAREDFIGPLAPESPSDEIDATINDGTKTAVTLSKRNGAEKPPVPSRIAQKPVRQSAPDITNLMLATIFTSSLAGLALAGLEVSKSGISRESAATFLASWGLIAAFLLVTAYFLSRQQKVVQFAARTNSRLFWTTLACSCLTISATALAFAKIPASNVLVAEAVVEKSEILPAQSSETVLEIASFKDISLGKRKFSEHFPTVHAFSGASPFPNAQPYVVQPDLPHVAPIMGQEVQNKKIAEKIIPAAAKPDRTIKAEKAKTSTARSAAPKTSNVKSTGFRDNSALDCRDIAALRTAECRSELK